MEVKLHLAVRNVPSTPRGGVRGRRPGRPDHDRREFVSERLMTESGHSAIQVLVHDAEYRHGLERLLSRFGATGEEFVRLNAGRDAR